jgi:hypothetical protein
VDRIVDAAADDRGAGGLRLVFAAVFNGVAAVPLIWIINRIAADRGTMGQARSGRLSRAVLAVTFIGMTASVLAMIVSYLKG